MHSTTQATRRIVLASHVDAAVREHGDHLARVVLTRAVLALASRRDELADGATRLDVDIRGATHPVSVWPAAESGTWEIAFATPLGDAPARIIATVRFVGAVAHVDEVAAAPCLAVDAADGWWTDRGDRALPDADAVDAVARMLREDLAHAGSAH